MADIDVQQITDENFARIHRAALVLTGNPWDADDLAQETFLVLSREQDRYQGRSSIYTFLYGILLNLERRHRRRHGIWKRKLKSLIGFGQTSSDSAPAAETAIEVREWKQSLWSEVSRLPDGQRQALVLRFSEQMPYEEIAEVLQCPLGTVKSRIHHGLASLRQRLEPVRQAMLEDSPDHAQEDLFHSN